MQNGYVQVYFIVFTNVKFICGALAFLSGTGTNIALSKRKQCAVYLV